MFVRVSDLTSYIYCPRVCYYRLRFGEEFVNEMHAARDIYISKRLNMGEKWAFEKFINYYGKENSRVFLNALKKFVYNPALESLNGVEWEIILQSEKFRLKGSIDELVEENEVKIPLVLSSNAPEEGIWFKDRIRLTAYCMLVGANKGYVYHCFDGELRFTEVDRRDRRQVLKLVERVARIKNGFIPDKQNEDRCKKCHFNERCSESVSTFARFLAKF
ncbi:MAG TPA: Dna2/Cas4 domain-containing protein [Archaeoglobaceae archaeon]|nr:Dna2/Cas4 domain-containing protein [Archaeoglobaceae archaeon]